MKSIIIRALTLFAVFCASLLVGVAAMSAVPAGSSPTVAPSKPSVAERLIRSHDCWTGDTPAKYKDIIPGHAVVSTDDRGARLAKSDVGFGIWLDGEPGHLYAFCK